MDGPAAQVVDEAPKSGLGVGGGAAPLVVVAAHGPLGAGFLGFFGAKEYVVDDQHAAAVDAAPATVFFHGGVAFRVATLVDVGGFVDGLEFPAAVVVDEAPAAVGGVAGGVDPLAGFAHGLPFLGGLACYVAFMEDVAADEVAVDVDDAPAVVEFDEGPFSGGAFEFAGALKAWVDDPVAVVAFVSEFLRRTLVGKRLCICKPCGKERGKEEYSGAFHFAMVFQFRVQRYDFF